MEELVLTLDARWSAGLLLAMTRIGVFVVASPLVGRAFPLPGRLAAVLAISLALTTPFEGPLTLAGLLGAGVANGVLGAALGYVTGLIFHAFAIGGALVDGISGLSIASVFDPSRGEQGALFTQMFHLTGLTMFLTLGGMELLVRGLAISMEAVPLDAGVSVDGAFASVVVTGVGRLMVLGLELALPVVAVLFIVEVVLGIASRFAPQANVFLLGLPAKLFVALSTTSVALYVFPDATEGVIDVVHRSFIETLNSLAAG